MTPSVKTGFQRGNGCSFPRLPRVRGVGKPYTSTDQDKWEKRSEGKDQVWVCVWGGAADEGTGKDRDPSSRSQVTAVKEPRQGRLNAEETLGGLQDLRDKRKPFGQLMAEWEQLAGRSRGSGWGAPAQTTKETQLGGPELSQATEGRASKSPEHTALPNPHLRSCGVLPLCPPGCPTLPTGAKERGDHPTWLSPVIQQCRGDAGTRPAGSYPELLFANWRKCSGV